LIPAFLASQQVLATFLAEQPKWGALPEMSTDALKQEFRLQPSTAAGASTLVQLENVMDYPAVASRYEVVADQRSTVVINQDIARRITCGETVRWQDVQMHSVQLRDRLVVDLGLQPLADGLYDWQGRKYDAELLGYMAEVL
jgi:hypothetical protein